MKDLTPYCVRYAASISSTIVNKERAEVSHIHEYPIIDAWPNVASGFFDQS